MSLSVPEAQAAPEPPGLWRNRGFLLVWGGQLVSTVGARATATALPLLVLALTGSAADAGLVGAFGSLPLLLAPAVAGPLVDRWDRRRTMLVCELVTALALAAVPLTAVLGALTLSQLAATAFVQSAASVFFGIAEHAALPLLVPAAQLQAAVAQNEAKGQGAGLAGPPLAGVLFAVGRTVPFLADAVTSLAAACGLLLLRQNLRAEAPETTGESMWREAGRGLAWVWRQRFVRTVTALIAAGNFAFQALVLLLVLLAHDHGTGSEGIGLMLGVYAGGGLVGALAAGRLLPHLRPGAVLTGAFWLWAAVPAALLLTRDPLLMGVIAGVGAFAGPLWNVVVITRVTALVPNDLLGRVTSAALLVANGAVPLASLAAGCLAAAVGTTATLALLAAATLATAIAAQAALR